MCGCQLTYILCPRLLRLAGYNLCELMELLLLVVVTVESYYVAVVHLKFVMGGKRNWGLWLLEISRK